MQLEPTGSRTISVALMLENTFQQKRHGKIDAIQRQCLPMDVVELRNRHVEESRRQQQRNGKRQAECQCHHLSLEDVPPDAEFRRTNVRVQRSIHAVHVQAVGVEYVILFDQFVYHQQRSILNDVQAVARVGTESN